MNAIEAPDPKIPDEIVTLCRSIVELCKAHGCYSIDLKLNPGWRESVNGQVQLQWAAGRHGAPSNCVIRTELLSRIRV